MSWHPFEKEKDYPLDYVVATINKHIKSGDVKDKEQKLGYLKRIQDSGHERIVYSPRGETWDSSPMNSANWKTLNNQPICEMKHVPKSRRR
jgi:hypothetical protein